MAEKTFIKHTSHDSMVLGENLKAENTRIGKYVDITRVWGLRPLRITLLLVQLLTAAGGKSRMERSGLFAKYRKLIFEYHVLWWCYRSWKIWIVVFLWSFQKESVFFEFLFVILWLKVCYFGRLHINWLFNYINKNYV